MTCLETRELFSALADEALPAAERAALEAHLAGCAECRREWARFRATVGLLQSIEPARAPAGFVDRVLDRARPRPWYRRLARDVFLPLPRKLPLEAAALLLVGGLAVWMFQRTPEQQQAARLETERPAVTQTAPEPRTPEGPGVTLSLDRRAAERSAPEVSPAPAAPTAAPPPARDERADERAAAATARAPAPAKKSAETENKTETLLSHRFETLPAPPAAPPEGARTRHEARAQAAPGAEAPVPPIVARLAVADTAAAVRELPALIGRLGGSLTSRGADGAVSVLDLVVPGAAYGTLRRELSRLGSFQAEREPEDARQPVTLRLSITAAPR